MKNGSGDFSWTNIYCCFASGLSSSFIIDFTFQPILPHVDTVFFGNRICMNFTFKAVAFEKRNTF